MRTAFPACAQQRRLWISLALDLIGRYQSLIPNLRNVDDHPSHDAITYAKEVDVVVPNRRADRGWRRGPTDLSSGREYCSGVDWALLQVTVSTGGQFRAAATREPLSR